MFKQKLIHLFFTGNPEARQILADWGLTLEDDTISTDGRMLPPETIFFGNREVPGSEIADWGREACRERVIAPVSLKDVYLICTL